MSSRQRESNRIKCDARERRRRRTPTTRSAGYIYTQYAITQRDATVVPRRPSSTNAAPPRAAAATNTTPSTRTTTYDPQNPYTQPTHTPITRIKKPTTDNRTFGKPILNTITLYETQNTERARAHEGASVDLSVAPPHSSSSSSSTDAMAREPTKTRVPLNDFENLAVGAFGGIVETCVQSASRRDEKQDATMIIATFRNAIAR